MPLIVGLSGATRNASATLCTPDRVLGICSQERITRVRGAGFNPTGLPDEALDEILRCAGRGRHDVTTYAWQIQSPREGASGPLGWITTTHTRAPRSGPPASARLPSSCAITNLLISASGKAMGRV